MGGSIFLDENIFQGIFELVARAPLDIIPIDLKPVLIAPGNELVIQYEGKQAHQDSSEQKGPC